MSCVLIGIRELNNMLDELDMLPDDEEDEDENPLSGYYSKN